MCEVTSWRGLLRQGKLLKEFFDQSWHGSASLFSSSVDVLPDKAGNFKHHQKLGKSKKKKHLGVECKVCTDKVDGQTDHLASRSSHPQMNVVMAPSLSSSLTRSFKTSPVHWLESPRAYARTPPSTCRVRPRSRSRMWWRCGAKITACLIWRCRSLCRACATQGEGWSPLPPRRV